MRLSFGGRLGSRRLVSFGGIWRDIVRCDSLGIPSSHAIMFLVLLRVYIFPLFLCIKTDFLCNRMLALMMVVWGGKDIAAHTHTAIIPNTSM